MHIVILIYIPPTVVVAVVCTDKKVLLVNVVDNLDPTTRAVTYIQRESEA
jgi:hypothetical protein